MTLTLAIAHRLTAALRTRWQAITPTERALILAVALLLVLVPR